MKITLEPETSDEKLHSKKVVHVNVKDFFLIGNKQEEDLSVIDFHDWKTNSYRYLVGSLYYFLKVLENEMSSVEKKSMPKKSSTIKITPEMLGLPSEEDLEAIEKKLENKKKFSIPLKTKEQKEPLIEFPKLRLVEEPMDDPEEGVEDIADVADVADVTTDDSDPSEK